MMLKPLRGVRLHLGFCPLISARGSWYALEYHLQPSLSWKMQKGIVELLNGLIPGQKMTFILIMERRIHPLFVPLADDFLAFYIPQNGNVGPVDINQRSCCTGKHFPGDSRLSSGWRDPPPLTCPLVGPRNRNEPWCFELSFAWSRLTASTLRWSDFVLSWSVIRREIRVFILEGRFLEAALCLSGSLSLQPDMQG